MVTSLGYAGPYAHTDQQNLILYSYSPTLCDYMSLQNDKHKRFYGTTGPLTLVTLSPYSETPLHNFPWM